MRIVIIGTGNTATVLGKLFQRHGHTIVQLIGRTGETTKQLAQALNVPFTLDNREMNRDADIYLIAVTDKAIQDVAAWLRVDKKLVIHTAASARMNLLESCTKNYGVLYPLQSLRKELNEIPVIPFLIDGNTEENRTLIADFASTLSSHVQYAGDEQRILTHIAAVFVSNFTNHLYVVAEQFCQRQEIDFSILKPLIIEITNRLEHFSPAQVQTGPAVRNDTETLDKHLQLLSDFPTQQAIYRFLTDSIIRWHAS